MSQPNSLIPLQERDLELERAPGQPIYDAEGNLLLGANSIVRTAQQRESLLKKGYIHQEGWDLPPLPRRRVPFLAPESPAQAEDEQIEESAKSATVQMEMDQVRWNIGEAMFLQSQLDPSQRYSCRLIGYLRNHAIMVTAPVIDGKIVFIKEGRTFVVRAFSGKYVYAFTAILDKTVHTAQPYLHLSWPRHVSATRVRQGVRAEVDLVASLAFGNAQQVHSAAARLCDLSAGGAAGLLKQTPAAPGEQGRMRFRLRFDGEEHLLDLKVLLRTLCEEEAGGYRAGFEFIQLNQQERLLLSAFVHQVLIAGLEA